MLGNSLEPKQGMFLSCFYFGIAFLCEHMY